MINLSAEERAYRAKHFHELRDLKDRQYNCCSCGNELNSRTGKLFAHPILGVLQCETCYRNKKRATKGRDAYSNCCVCGSSTKLCYCKSGKCQSTFCRACIKRNANLSLLDVDLNNRWVCFLCESKPLWKLRGVCAIILGTHFGENKRGGKCEKTDIMQRSKTKPTCNSKTRRKIAIAMDDSSHSSDDSGEEEKEIRRRPNKRKEQSKNSSSGISNSDTETQVSTQRKPSNASTHSNLYRKGGKTGSSLEFDEFKLTSSGRSTLKRVSARIGGASQSSKAHREKAESTISKEQSFCFKSKVTQLLNKFKNLCWEFELKLDEIKCLHLRKEIDRLEDANHISAEMTKLAKKLMVDLGDECKELKDFHQGWRRVSAPHDESSFADADDSISSEEPMDNDVALSSAETEKYDDKEEDKHSREATREEEQESSKKESCKASENEKCVNNEEVVSDLDSEVIFSETEEKSKACVPRRAASDSPKSVASALKSNEFMCISETENDSSNVTESPTKGDFTKSLTDTELLDTPRAGAKSETELKPDEKSDTKESPKLGVRYTEVIRKSTGERFRVKIQKKRDARESDDNSDNAEEATKRALLRLSSDSDSDSDDSDKESTKPNDTLSPHGNEIGESATDNDDSKLEQCNNDSDQNSDGSSNVSAGTKLTNGRLLTNSILAKYRSNKQLQMRCAVEVQRMSKKELRNYQAALSKSKEHLQQKKLESLIDVDKLDRKSKRASISLRTRDRPRRTKAAEESSGEESTETLDCMEKSICDSDDSDSVEESNNTVGMNAESVSDSENIVKEMLLNSSDSDTDREKPAIESSDNEKDKAEKEPTPRKNAQKNDKSAEDSDNDTSKSKWRRDKLLTMKFSDSEAEMEKVCEKMAEKRNSKADVEEEDQSTQDEIQVRKKITKRGRKRLLLSDSDDEIVKSSENSEESDSSSDIKKTKQKRKWGNNSADADSSEGEKKKKRVKRRRIKQVDSDDSDSQNSDDSRNNKKGSDHLNSSQGSSGVKGRKNIRKVLKDTRVTADTKQAAKEEEERMKRIADRQKLYNELYEQRLAAEEKLEELVLDFDSETKKPLVSVHKEIVKYLKPHQANGIRFMWNSCFESLERLKTSQGSGCILAHCMGLGKTLQVISLAHTVLMHDDIDIKTIMIVSPLSTVLNWTNEISKWLKDTGDADDIEVYELTKMKTNLQRMYQLESWQRTGGILIIGYQMFRNLATNNKKVRKNMKESMMKCLIDPGADLVVCDEGHLLKNEDTALSKCMTRIKTYRRIVLTGTPLQNNLIEYHCMVQFVKPSLLGTKHEFQNRFVNPINNGQFDDSTAHDVKLMKKRAYVLNKMLKGCVQRYDYSVLMPFLPPKQEYVILIGLTEVQIKLYQHYLDHFARKHSKAGSSLFADFQVLQRVWSHPLSLRYHAEKQERLHDKQVSGTESEGSLKDFIDDDSVSDSSSSDENDDIQEIVPQRSTRGRKAPSEETIKEPEAEDNEKEGDANKYWWEEYVQKEHLTDMRVSGKLMLFFGILKECQQIGDKLLVFSQSLYSLRLIEEFLMMVDGASGDSEHLNGHTGNWTLGADYFRLDGQTSTENRNNWCKIFNRPTNTRARLFLISTRAGGLGINLTAANRVIIFDASWNPSQDMQSIYRIYRFGQKKPCYVYRFLAAGTMEQKIYNRQVTKLSLSCRVVDEQQIERHYTNSALSELYKLEPNITGEKPTLNLPRDRLLADMFLAYKDYVENYHEHDSLLENKTDEELDQEERKQAWLEYEEEKKEKPRQMLPMPQVFPNNVFNNQFGVLGNFNTTELQNLEELIRKDYPNITADQQKQMAMRKLIDMYSYVERQAIHGHNFQLPTQQQMTAQMFALQQQQQFQQQQLQKQYQQQQQQRLQQQARNERDIVPNPYASGTVGTSAPRQVVDNDVIEINPSEPTVQPQEAPSSGNRNQEE